MTHLPDQALLRAFGERVRSKIARDLAQEGERADTLRTLMLPKVREGLALARAEGLCGRAWLFGSYAWGEPRDSSDVDLMVEGSDEPLMVAAVVGRITETEMHVVAVERAPESLVERVQSEGVSL